MYEAGESIGLFASHPTRVRGLKSTIDTKKVEETVSHPTRVRGLKSRSQGIVFVPAFVAPYTGAWIEIPRTSQSNQFALVAPYTGAWIEIGHWR